MSSVSVNMLMGSHSSLLRHNRKENVLFSLQPADTSIPNGALDMSLTSFKQFLSMEEDSQHDLTDSDSGSMLWETDGLMNTDVVIMVSTTGIDGEKDLHGRIIHGCSRIWKQHLVSFILPLSARFSMRNCKKVVYIDYTTFLCRNEEEGAILTILVPHDCAADSNTLLMLL